MIIFINDTTVKPQKEAQCTSYQEAVRYLEGMSIRAYNQTRKQRMIILEELGHGYDDNQSVSFVRSMATAFEMGIIRNNAGQLQRMKCDITSIAQYQAEEFGN